MDARRSFERESRICMSPKNINGQIHLGAFVSQVVGGLGEVTSLRFSFLLCKMGLIITHTSQSCCEN
jgi:hypothetical protein